MRKMKYWIVASLVLGLSPWALAGTKHQDIIKAARNNDSYACKYLLSSEYQNAYYYDATTLANLYRADCDRSGHSINPTLVNRDVLDFKISQHPNDRALVYFVKDEYGIANLWELSSITNKTQFLTRDIKKINGHFKYDVIPSTDTTIVMVSLSNNGSLRAWDNDGEIEKWLLIEDYRLNPNFGKAGMPFSSYAVFAIDKAGYVIKIKGKDFQNSKAETTKKFNSIDEFLRVNKLSY